MNHGLIVETIRAAALEAGSAIMEVYGAEDFEVRSKDDASPVTEADERADALISARLRAALPDIPLVTEEQADSHDLSAPVFLIVDPLDGTKEFIKRRGDFTVNIALVEDGVPTLGVVYAPARDRLFYTLADGGAVEEAPPLSAPKPIRVGTPNNAALVVVASKSHRDAALEEYIGLYDVKDSAAAGSSLKFCLLATGEADLYPRLGPTMEWDTAAGHAVLAAAGGAVLDYDSRAPLRYGKPGFRNPFFIAHVPGVALK